MRPFSAFALLTVWAVAQVSSQEFADLECEVKKAALAYGNKIIGSASPAFQRGLNFASNCTMNKQESQQASRVSRISRRARPERPHAHEDAIQFFVSPSGDDTNPGTSEKPFKTLEQARDAIRFQRRQLASRDDFHGAVVTLTAGKYFTRRPFHLSSEDGGTASGPITYTAAEGQQGKVILSGGAQLTLDWQKTTANPNIYMAKVPNGTRSTSLFVNGVRQIRARFPNGDPQQMSGICYSKTQGADEGCPGYASAQGGLEKDAWLDDLIKNDEKRHHTSQVFKRRRKRSRDAIRDTKVGITVSDPLRPHKITGDDHFNAFHYITDNGRVGVPRFGPVFSFWNNPYTSRPTGVKYDPKVFNKTWKTPETGVVHMFHSGLWGNWMFQLASRDTSADEFHFAYGGWQEARGGGVRNNHFYVENIFEELDVPGEWFLDEQTSTLYLYPNETVCADITKAEVVVPQHATLVRMLGSYEHPVSHVAFNGITFTETRPTFMDYYEVPSGGDWSIHRGGSFFMQGVTECTVSDCVFNATGGNAIFLSEYVRNVTISKNEITLTGDSAIAAVGRTGMIDGMQPTYPAGNTIVGNHIHDFGMFGKQVSCYFQSLACGNTVQDNVCYNGPRAGINFNDGFGGANLLTGNLVFNMVRETGDHGPFNSWDRQPYITPGQCTTGDPNIVPAPNRIDKNFIINGYSGVWALDHDDGSAYYNDTNNFLVFGGLKNYLGHDKMSGPGNVVVYPGIGPRSNGGRKCQTDDNGEYAFQYYYGNQCFTPDGDFYTFSHCDPGHLSDHVYETHGNTHYSPNATFKQSCGTKSYDFKAWQAAGQDIDSTVQDLPSPAAIVAMGMKAIQG